MSTGIPRHFDVAGPLAGQGGAADCLVPLGATVVVIKLAAVQPAGTGHLAVWPFGATADVGNAIRFKAGSRGLQMVLPELLIPICNPAATSCTHGASFAEGSPKVSVMCRQRSGVNGPDVPPTPPRASR